MTNRLIAPLSASALAWALVAGCSPAEPRVEPVEPTADASPVMPDEPFADADPVEALVLDDGQIELIQQLPEADSQVALSQKACPVSDKPLGSMGVPVKVEAKGIPVFLCCDGCKDGVAEDPDAILAKVPQGQPDAAPLPAPKADGEGS